MNLKWTDKYSVNNEIIDLQHKMLFTIINDLNKHIAKGDGLDFIEETLEKMSVYATMHFRTEEDLLFKSDYLEYQKHKECHESFKKIILKATKEIIDEKKIETVITIHKFLHDWITSHILDEDVKYCGHID